MTLGELIAAAEMLRRKFGPGGSDVPLIVECQEHDDPRSLAAPALFQRGVSGIRAAEDLPKGVMFAEIVLGGRLEHTQLGKKP